MYIWKYHNENTLYNYHILIKMFSKVMLKILPIQLDQGLTKAFWVF
jgi:hypothetical protein